VRSARHLRSPPRRPTTWHTDAGEDNRMLHEVTGIPLRLHTIHAQCLHPHSYTRHNSPAVCGGRESSGWLAQSNRNHTTPWISPTFVRRGRCAPPTEADRAGARAGRANSRAYTDMRVSGIAAARKYMLTLCSSKACAQSCA
jgi:hypothetical protein